MTRASFLAAVAATVAMWLFAFSLPRDFTVGNFIDDAHYAVLAKSIREHQTYRTLNLPGQPPETKYPPGFPALLALTWSPERSDAHNLQSLQSVNLWLVGPLAGALTLMGVVALGLHPAIAAGGAIAGLLAPKTAEFWTAPLSETLFLLLVIVGLIGAGTGRLRWSVGAFLAATYVRTVAMAFGAAVLILCWWRRHPDRLRLTVATVIGVAPWMLWQAVHRNAIEPSILGMHGSYGAWYLDSLRADWTTVLFRVPVENAVSFVQVIGANLLGQRWAAGGVAGLVGVLIVWRVWAARRIAPIATLGLGLYTVIVLAWPFPVNRFVGAAWPLVLLIAAASLRRWNWTVVLAALVLAVPSLSRNDAVLGHRIRGRLSDATVARMRPEIPPDVVLATTNAPLHYLQFGVATVPAQRMRAYRWYRLGYWSTAWGLADDLWATIQDHEVSMVAVERRGVEGRYAAGGLEAQCPAALVEVWPSTANELLFRVNPEAPCDVRAGPR